MRPAGSQKGQVWRKKNAIKKLPTSTLRTQKKVNQVKLMKGKVFWKDKT